MKTNRITIYTALLVACSLFPAAIAGAQEMKTLTGHVPAAISRLHLKSQGQLAPDYTLNLAVSLPLRNTGDLSNLLEQVYDPASTNYHHFLTPSEFTAQFGPSADDYQKVMEFAHSNGFSIVGMHPNRLLLDVRGKASDIEKAFHVNLKTYGHPTEHRDFYAPDADPTVGASLPVLHISGLDNYSLPHSFLHMQPANRSPSVSAVQSAGAAPQPNARPAIGSAPGGAYWGNDFRSAYVPGTSLSGTGQSVALLEFDGFFTNDIATYATQIGLTNPPNVVVVPVQGGVTSPEPSDAEPPLDIEMVMAMAPGVSTIYVYEAPANGSLWDDLISRIATDDLARQVSSSWGLLSGPDPAAEEIYQQMALQGQSVFQASGDSDAYAGQIPFPSDSPYQTIVGGTTLTMNGTAASYASETVWNWGIEFPGQGFDGVGSSGGFSTTYSVPSWQTNVNFTACQGSSVARNLPDVALTADNVWVDFGSGQSGTVGGTSCAAPLWAGFIALVNQQSAKPVGFLNPTLYSLALRANYTNYFHDITTGNNTWSGSPNLFNAVSNYDLCTGLGTPNGTNLIDALTANPVNFFTHLSPPLPPYGTNMAALTGGNPNGNWSLFVDDDELLNSGLISNGWSITLTTANPIGYVADNGLTLSASQTNLPPNGLVTFNINVVNYGPSISSNVVVADSFPNNFTLVSASPNGIYSPTANSESWNVGNLAVSQATNLTLTLQAPAAPEQFAEDFASVHADTPDQNSADDSAVEFLNVISASAPQLGSVMVGSGGKFQLTVSNPSGLPVVIQASTNLVNWVNVWTNNASPFTFTDSVSPGFPDRFYRAILQ